MNLTIDNLQGQGPQDYTESIDVTKPPKLQRKLNQPVELQVSLLANLSTFVVPASGARVVLSKDSGALMFTGYLISAPEYEYLGWGQEGPIYRYNLVSQSDEIVLDRKALPNRAPFVNRTAGAALIQLAEDLLPGWFDTSAVQSLDTIASYAVDPQKSFSFHAAEIAVTARGSFRAMNGELILAPIGEAAYSLNESDENFSPAGLSLSSPNMLVNEVTVIGRSEPQAYVRDYFVGDGESLKFYLSQRAVCTSKTSFDR